MSNMEYVDIDTMIDLANNVTNIQDMYDTLDILENFMSINNNPFLYQIVDRCMFKFTDTLCNKKDIVGIKSLYERFYSYEHINKV